MQQESTAGIQMLPLFRPSPETEACIRIEAENHLFSKFKPGIYKNGNVIDEILEFQFSFYEKKLNSLLGQFCSLPLLRRVLDEYDLGVQAEYAYRKTQMLPEAMFEWKRLGITFRQASKHYAELIVQRDARTEWLAAEGDLFGTCWVCCEEIVRFSNLISQTYYLFPQETTLTIHKPRGIHEDDLLCSLDVTNFSEIEKFIERISTDRNKRNSLGKDIRFDRNKAASCLDLCLKQELGFSFSEVFEYIEVLRMRDGFTSRRDNEINYLVGRGLEERSANILLNGIVLSSVSMRNQCDNQGNVIGRVFRRTKQKYRAYARPFFQLEQEGRLVLIWSFGMAGECAYAGFLGNLSHSILPEEWTNRNTQKTVENYSAAISKEFEQITLAELRKLALNPQCFNKSIGAVAIPSHIGEIDCIVFLPQANLLIVADCKLVKTTHDPVTFNDDNSKFFSNPKKNYREQILRKANWVKSELANIGPALKRLSMVPNDATVNEVLPIIITYTPTFASYFMRDVKCLTLMELLDDISSGDFSAFPRV